MTVKLKATDLDVYVDGVRVGWVTGDAGDWRASLSNPRRRLRLMNEYYDTRAAAVRAVVEASR